VTIRNIRLPFALAVAISASAFAQTTSITSTSNFSFPLVGLATTETVGVNLINLAADFTNGNAASCTGSVTFISQAGATIGTATTFTLAAGAVGVIILPFSASGIIGTRGLVRTVVSATTTSNVPCSLSYSLNTYDTVGGATHVFMQGTGSILGQPLSASTSLSNPASGVTLP
jgi:hypothetical protein